MRSGTLLVRIGMVAVGMALLVGAACRPKVIVVTGMPSGPTAMPECPHDWERDSVRLRAMLPGEIAGVPEFHDCQRLRASDEGYGVLAAVFARDSLARVPDSLFAVPRGRSVALVYLPPDPDTRFSHEYAPLGLSKRFACVVVRRAPGADEAWIVPVDDGMMCWSPDALEATATDSPLELRVVDQPTDHGREVPPVARWDWDARTATQYIGARCGTKWCEVGVRGFESSASHDPGEGAGPMRLGYAMRGAYDEQRLAEFDAEGLKSAMNLGTVVPMPDLERLARQLPEAGAWIEAARTHLFPEAGTYEEKFNFAASRVAHDDPRASLVSLCRSTDAAPCAPRARRAVLDLTACTPGADGARWVARVDRPGAESRYFCVVYRRHAGTNVAVPPVVRWRWRADDETIWISCPSGCCEVNADL